MATARRRGSPDTITASCLASDLLGRAVYVSGPKIGALYQVRTTDIDSATPVESISVGVISAKIDATTCIVQLHGILELASFSGLPIGRVFVGTGGLVTNILPTPLPSSSRILQRIGYILSPGILDVSPEEPIGMRS